MNINSILAGTPLWVWCVLGYLLFIGYKATKARVVFVPTLWLMPSLLFAFFGRNLFGCSLLLIPYFFIAFSMGIVLGVGLFQPRFTVFDSKKLLIRLEGSFVLLGLIALLFPLKYFFGVLNALYPEIATSLKWVELSFSGLFSGIMWGRMAPILSRFYRTN